MNKKITDVSVRKRFARIQIAIGTDQARKPHIFPCLTRRKRAKLLRMRICPEIKGAGADENAARRNTSKQKVLVKGFGKIGFGVFGVIFAKSIREILNDVAYQLA